MLTIKDINEVSFGKAGFSGYKPEDVDNFIDEVAASFQELQAERDDAVKRVDEVSRRVAELTARNSEMQEKLAILAEKVESYRNEEDGIKEAIISAQRLARESIQEAKDKAEIILEDAEASSRKLMDEAKIEASKAAKEYMAQAESKKQELEEVKRQVSAFRVSLLEMYKKHLECINHIPVFRQKEAPAQPERTVVREEAPAETPPEPEPVPAPAPREEPVRREDPVRPARKEVSKPAAPPKQEHRHAEQTRLEASPQKAPTLEDKVDYTKEQLQAAGIEEDYLDEDLTDMGIDLHAYSSIPETLKKEKNSHFSNLEFGDGVEIAPKRKK